MMREYLREGRFNDDFFREIPYATLRFDHNGTVLGWALTFVPWPEEYYSSYFYVRQAERRKGIGKRLINHVNKHFGQVRVYPHDPASTGFFDFVHKNKLNT